MDSLIKRRGARARPANDLPLVSVLAIVSAGVAPVTSVHEEMYQRTRDDQQIRQSTEDMRGSEQQTVMGLPQQPAAYFLTPLAPTTSRDWCFGSPSSSACIPWYVA